MTHLLRVSLPDIPGSLGRVASAIGLAGGNIDAIEIVDRISSEGLAVDDFFVTMDDGVMPDSVISACNVLDDVEVLWISRYLAGSNIFLDLEVVEEMTSSPAAAFDLLLDGLPEVFRVDWAMRVRRTGDAVEIIRSTQAAPESLPTDLVWPEIRDRGVRVGGGESWADGLVAACPISGAEELMVVARRGGPEFLDSEIARLTHLCALARSISAG